MKLFMDIHVIQALPPSCLNRDDTGSPKTAVYGGVRRSRVSSQSWKRAMREMFREHFDESELSYRTLKIFDLIADRVQEKAPDYSREDALKLVHEVLKKVKVEAKKNEDKSDALFFLSSQQAKNLAALALGDIEGKESEKAIRQALQDGNGVDLALFGRMVASNAELNCDASAQVAHAISTHRVENEYDYFTAVDDCSTEEHAGAGMIGTVEYNSSTMYRYATVALHDLYDNLSKDVEALQKAIKEFTRAFILSIPSGKQNTFAAHTLPYAVMVSLRSCRPLNLADAFERPVKSNEGFTEKSAKILAEHATKAYESFCAKPEVCYVIGEELAGLGERVNIEELLTNVSRDVVEKVAV
jgi:CRISPR system Cascade subunit CasC